MSLFFLISLQASGEKNFLADAERESPVKKNNSKNSLYELQKTLNDIYELYKDSVVFISTEKSKQKKFDDPADVIDWFSSGQLLKKRTWNIGTGFMLTSDGYICTNYHIIKNVENATVTVSGKSYTAVVAGYDSARDIALLKINGRTDFKPVYLGNSDNVKTGDFVVAIGNPFGLDRSFTSGIVSGTGRKELDGTSNPHIQTDAAINQGNSGGPLINIDGEVIGVNRAIFSSTGESNGIGFAIPINDAKHVIIEIMKKNSNRKTIGITTKLLAPDDAARLNLKNVQGIIVTSVEKGSSAEKSGIKNDDIIIKLNDARIAGPDDFDKQLSSMKAGSSVRLTLLRNGEMMSIWVTLSAE